VSSSVPKAAQFCSESRRDCAMRGLAPNLLLKKFPQTSPAVLSPAVQNSNETVRGFQVIFNENQEEDRKRSVLKKSITIIYYIIYYK
jgi:hypothetical protein